MAAEAEENPPTQPGDGKDVQAATESTDDWRGVGLLSIAWACAFSTLTVTIATISLVGKPFSPGAAADTVPLACVFYFTGLANAAIPAEVRRLGRQRAYVLGAALGILGCTVCALAMLRESFALLCLGGSLFGMALAHAQNYRFAAVLLAGSDPPKAISWVTAGGVLGAAIGPGVLARARHLLPLEFAGIYVLCAGMHTIAVLLLLGVKFASGSPGTAKGPNTLRDSEPRSLASIFSQPRCWVATFASLAAYAVMMLVMAPTPLVMRLSFGHTYDEATYVMMCHMVLMFAPSPATGNLIRRLGPAAIMLAGCVGFLLAAALLLAGTSLLSFFAGLSFLGIGWNFLFIAGTSQLASTYRPAEGPRVQAWNDGIVFVASGTASVVSASVVDSLGWDLTQVLVMGCVVVTAMVAVIPPATELLAKPNRRYAATG